jgi:BASS family bile acid:Na+ symporter
MSTSAEVAGEEEAIASAPTPVLLTLLGVVVVSLMFGLGSTLDKETVRKTLKHKLPPFVGITCQYAIMPAIAYGLAKAFGFSPAKSIGLLLCGIVPGGSTSNLFTYYIGGDVGLSIFMTVTSVLVAIGMVPLLLWAYGTALLRESNVGEEDISITVPYTSLIVTLLLAIIPTLGGIYLRSQSIQWAKRAEIVGSIVGALFVLGALVSGIMDNLELFGSGVATWIASALLSVIGFGLGTLVPAFVFHLPRRTCLTIGLEVGIQNTILSITITFVLFANAETSVLNEALVFPLMCSLWDVANSILITFIVLLAKRLKKEKQQPPDPNTTNETNHQNNEESTTTRQSDDGLQVGPNDNTVDSIVASPETVDSVSLPENEEEPV